MTVFRGTAVAFSDVIGSDTVVVTRPSCVDGDVILITYTAYGVGGDIAGTAMAGASDSFTDGPRLTHANVFTGWCYKVASSEPATYTMDLDPDVQAIVGLCSVFHKDRVAGSISVSTFGSTFATTDASAPFQAGWSGVDNSTADKVGIYITGVVDFVGGAGTLVRKLDGATIDTPDLYAETLVDASAVVGADGWINHRVYEEVRDDDFSGSGTTPAFGSAVWENPTGDVPVIFVGGLWLPGFTENAVATAADGGILAIHTKKVHHRPLPYLLGRDMLRE